MVRPIGIDISKHNGTFDPDKATKPIDFIFQRASWASHKDERFNILLPGVKKIPRRGAYHYYSSGVPWEQQAELFLNASSGQGFTVLVVDYEEGYNNLTERTAKELELFLRLLIAEKPQKTIMGYFGSYIYRDYIQPYVDIRDIPAWIPRYFILPRQHTRTILYPINTDRSDWAKWQYTKTGSGAAYGCGERYVDINVFNGTTEELDTLFKINVAPPLPPPPPVDCKPSQIAVLDEVIVAVNDIKEAL